MEFKISLATSSEIEILVKHRLSMWRDILDAHEDLVETPGNEERTRNWIEEKLTSGKLIGFVARTENERVAGSGCIWLREQPPLPFTKFVEGPYLLSMYTEKEFRCLGVGRMIVEVAIAWCKEHGYDRVMLDASEAGKRLYEKMGFQLGYSMRLQL